MNYKLAALIRDYMREAPALSDGGEVVYVPQANTMIMIVGHNLVEREITYVRHSVNELTNPIIHTTDNLSYGRETYGMLGIVFKIYTQTGVIT